MEDKPKCNPRQVATSSCSPTEGPQDYIQQIHT